MKASMAGRVGDACDYWDAGDVEEAMTKRLPTLRSYRTFP